MNKKEFSQWFARQVLGRWPTWQVNDVILTDWFAAFGRFDEVLLTRAVQHHKIYDDTSSPKTKRMLEIVRKLSSAKPKEPPQQDNRKGYTFNQYWEMVRTTWSKEKRIENMLGWIKWYPGAKEKDPEAYNWVVKDRLHDKLDTNRESRDDRPGMSGGSEPVAIDSVVGDLGVFKNV